MVSENTRQVSLCLLRVGKGSPNPSEEGEFYAHVHKPPTVGIATHPLGLGHALV